MSGWLLQGAHGVGKSTLLHRLLGASERACTGYYTQRILAGGCTMGFVLRPLAAAQPVALAAAYTPALESAMFLRRQGEAFVAQPQCFLQAALPVLQAATEKPASLVVLDELGGVELLSPEFRETLEAVLEHCPVVGTFKSEANAGKLRQKAGLEGEILARHRRKLLADFATQGVAVATLTSDNHKEIEAGLWHWLKGEE